MKTQTSQPTASLNLAATRIREACLSALKARDDAVQKAISAGQLLNDFKDTIPHGTFMEWRQKYLPEISNDTAERWMRAASNVIKALPPVPDAIDVEVSISQILTLPEAELSETQREWKQQWFDFTENKTIKECLAGVFVDGDAASRVDRAINGKTKGGAGGDRKDFPLFVAVKLKDMGAHFAHWRGMTETQRTEVKEVIRSAILGDASTLRGRNRKPFAFQTWPDEVCVVALEALKDRLKGANRAGQRREA
jgi:hypothetical protein